MRQLSQPITKERRPKRSRMRINWNENRKASGWFGENEPIKIYCSFAINDSVRTKHTATRPKCGQQYEKNQISCIYFQQVHRRLISIENGMLCKCLALSRLVMLGWLRQPPLWHNVSQLHKRSKLLSTNACTSKRDKKHTEQHAHPLQIQRNTQPHKRTY